MIYELAVFNLSNALVGYSGKADRLELCENKKEGGVTPSDTLIDKVLELGNKEVFIMIRCRPGDFVYTDSEMNSMIKNIHRFKNFNITGFVFGGLKANNNIDEYNCIRITDSAFPLPVTFHRAFDSTPDLYKAAEKIIKCGFKRILTSGGKINAYEGRLIISNLIKQFGNEIIFIPGGGIRKSNYISILKTTEATEIHSSKILI